MAQFTFVNTSPGVRLFLNPNFWTPHGVPGAGDYADLPASSEAYSAVVSSNRSVNALATGLNAIVEVGRNDNFDGQFSNVTLTATNGSGGGTNAGTIMIDGINCSFVFGGSLDNAGSVIGASFNPNQELIPNYNEIISNDGTLVGGGTVNFATVEGITPSSTLVNADNTIANCIFGALNVTNQINGILLSDKFTGSSVVNSGTIENAFASGVTIDSSSGGVVNGASFGGVTVVGGTLEGTLDVGTGVGNLATTIDGSSVVTNDGTLHLENDQFEIQGTIDNSGTISLTSSGSRTWMQVSKSGGSLTGAGLVLMNDNPNNRILGTLSGSTGHWSVSTLSNANTIVGAGSVGVNLALTNLGVIDATGPGASPTSNTASLIIATGYVGAVGSNTIANSGTLEATNPSSFATTGGLILQKVVIVNTPGKGLVEAIGTDTHVDLQSATISGGNLKTSGGGVIDTLDGGSVLNGNAHTVFVQGAFTINDGTGLTLEGAIANSGAISLAASAHATTLTIGVGTVLSGDGTLTLTDNADNAVVEGPPGLKGAQASLTNVNNTISGAGRISADLTNSAAGIVDASGANALVLNSGSAAIANNGLLEVTGIGGLTIASAVTGTGSAKITTGTLNAEAAFSQDVAFTAGAGELELGNSQGYGGSVSGFSTTGGTSFDLRDIGFVSSKEATFVGTASGGILTVTDGTRTASIKLSGNYLSSTFTASSDGQGGTIVVDPHTQAAEHHIARALHRFISATATLRGSTGGEVGVGHGSWGPTQSVLVAHEANP